MTAGLVNGIVNARGVGQRRGAGGIRANGAHAAARFAWAEWRAIIAVDTLGCPAYSLPMPATQTPAEYTYTIRTVCLSGARPWCAIVKGERWPSEGRSGRYPSEGMALGEVRLGAPAQMPAR